MKSRIQPSEAGRIVDLGLYLEQQIGRVIARRYSYLLEESPGSGEQAAR